MPHTPNQTFIDNYLDRDTTFHYLLEEWAAYDPEYVVPFTHEGMFFRITVMKVGGGTLGRRYPGAWLFQTSRRIDGRRRVVDQGQFTFNAQEFTHREVAQMVVLHKYGERLPE